MNYQYPVQNPNFQPAPSSYGIYNNIIPQNAGNLNNFSVQQGISYAPQAFDATAFYQGPVNGYNPNQYQQPPVVTVQANGFSNGYNNSYVYPQVGNTQPYYQMPANPYPETMYVQPSNSFAAPVVQPTVVQYTIVNQEVPFESRHLTMGQEAELAAQRGGNNYF